MENIKSRIQSANNLIEQVIQAKESDSQSKYIASKNNKFFDAYNLLTPSVSSYLIAKKYFDFSISDDLVKKITDTMNAAKNIFSNSLVTKPDNFKKDVDYISQCLKNEWKNHFQVYNKDISKKLSILAQIAPDKANIRKIKQSLDNCSSWPLKEDMCNRYFESVKSAKNTLSKYKLDEEIETFLDKVISKNATLSDLTDNILNWIKSENLSDKIVLTIIT